MRLTLDKNKKRKFALSAATLCLMLGGIGQAASVNPEVGAVPVEGPRLKPAPKNLSSLVPIDLSGGHNEGDVRIAVRSPSDFAGGNMRLTVYAGEGAFLKEPLGKFQGQVAPDGMTEIVIPQLQSGEYAFVVYYDENRDGKLNKNFFGRPKEPYIFSNNHLPKMRKPSFEDVKVSVSPGQTVEMIVD